MTQNMFKMPERSAEQSDRDYHLASAKERLVDFDNGYKN